MNNNIESQITYKLLFFIIISITITYIPLNNTILHLVQLANSINLFVINKLNKFNLILLYNRIKLYDNI